MKQKITLEIQNDTGLEFEERGEYRPPQQGEYFIADYSNKIECAVDYFERKHYIVLTPKVDQELDLAKKLIGKWVKMKHENLAIKVEKVRRLDAGIYVQNSHSQRLLELVEPFPLPTWRCCESDKPKNKKEGERYFVRCKFDHRCKNVHKFTGQSFTLENSLDFEWLDEGEK